MQKYLRYVKYSVIALYGMQALNVYADRVDYTSLEQAFGQAITTSALGKPQKESDVPVTMTIITAKEIERSGITNTIDIPTLISRTTGATLWQMSRTSPNLGIRGQIQTNNPSMLVLVNGKQVYLDTYGYMSWENLGIQLQEIKQIEFIRGPMTSLFGFNAATGVINIVTYDPQYDNVNTMGVGIGSGRDRQAYGVATFKVADKAHVRVSGGMARLGEYSANRYGSTSGSQQDLIADNQLRNFSVDSSVQAGEKTQVRLEASLAHPNASEFYGYSGSTQPNTTRSAKLTVNTDSAYGSTEISAYHNRYIAYISSLYSNTDQKISVGYIKHLFKVGTDHTVRFLLEGRSNKIGDASYLGSTANSFYFDAYAAAGMWDWVINKAFEFSAAVRGDTLKFKRSGPAPTIYYTSNSQYSKRHSTFSANAGLVYKMTDADTFKLAYGRGVQAPSLIQAGVDWNIGGAAYIIGNANISPTIVTNYELGYERLISQIDGKAKVVVFHNKLNSLFNLSATSTTIGGVPTTIAGNIGSAQTNGLDASIEGAFAKAFTWGLGYSYQNIKESMGGLNNPTITVAVNHSDGAPKHFVNAKLGYTNGAFEADLFGQVSSRFKMLSAIGTTQTYQKVLAKSFFTVSGRLGYRVDNSTTAYVTGSQLNQGKLVTNPGLQTERRFFFGISKKI